MPILPRSPTAIKFPMCLPRVPFVVHLAISAIAIGWKRPNPNPIIRKVGKKRAYVFSVVVSIYPPA